MPQHVLSTLRWPVLFSVLMLITVLQAYYSCYLSVMPTAIQFYGVDRTKILLMGNLYNIMYMIICPFILNIITRRYTLVMIISAFLIGAGSVGRWWSGNHYEWALLSAMLMAISQPFINPYGLVKLFGENEQPYIISISYLIPGLGFNFSYLYGVYGIQNDVNKIDSINLIIAITGLVSMIIGVLAIIPLQPKLDISQSQQIDYLQILTKLKHSKDATIFMVVLSVLTGIFWTYGSMFGVIFEKHNLTLKQEAFLGVATNFTSLFGGNIGVYIYRKYSYLGVTAQYLIKLLAVTALACSSFFQLTVILNLNSSLGVLILVEIVMGIAFSSIVPLSFIRLEREYNSLPIIIITTIFLTFANLFNLVSIEYFDYLGSSSGLWITNILLMMSTVIIFSIINQKGLQTHVDIEEMRIVQSTEL